MFNWRREAERFAPSLAVLLLHGSDRRRRFDAIPDHDLVLTTYPLLPRDQEALRGRSYHLLILDEAQAIKNPRSKAAQAARSAISPFPKPSTMHAVAGGLHLEQLLCLNLLRHLGILLPEHLRPSCI